MGPLIRRNKRSKINRIQKQIKRDDIEIVIFNSVESSRRAGKLAATATCLTPECYTQPCGVRHEWQLLSCDLSRHISAKTVTRKSLTFVQCKQEQDCAEGARLAQMPMTSRAIGMSIAMNAKDCAKASERKGP